MNHCLDDDILLAIYTGEGDPRHRAHLGACLTCARRYRRLAEDLGSIMGALQRPPALPIERHPSILPLWRWSLAAALVVGAFLCGRLTGLHGLSLIPAAPMVANEQPLDYASLLEEDDGLAMASYTPSMDDLLTPVDAGPDFTVASQGGGVN